MVSHGPALSNPTQLKIFIQALFKARSKAAPRLMLFAAAGLSLSGCATSGAIDFRCDGFNSFVVKATPSRIVQEIQSDKIDTIQLPGGEVPLASTQSISPGLFDAMKRLTQSSRARMATSNARPAVLLLSGGGQWGAFGAGFLKQLHDQGKMPADFQVITGISTGGMQSLFVATDRIDAHAYDRMLRNYSPASESEVVDRHKKKLMAGITGSLAGLKPLRRGVEAALCTKGDPALGCPMIDLLAKSGRDVFVGFVHANSGELQYARAVPIASTGTAEASVEQRRNAQQCLAAIALASAAMPVFFQQVRINGETYYDGGVRQSVFEENVAENLDAAVKAANAEAGQTSSTQTVETPDLYVLRNGPTELLGPNGKPNSPSPDADRSADALTAAFRAEAIVVNQLEVGSIAALRIAHPTGSLKLVTADGFNGFGWTGPDNVAYPGCPKPADVMFDPRFMLCLQSFGRSKAERTVPWITISPLDLTAAAAGVAAMAPSRAAR